MKCIYSIPPDETEVARKFAGRYADALSRLSEDVIVLSDDLRVFAETHSAAVLKVDDDEWDTATVDLVSSDKRRMVGELFWSPNDALAVFEELTRRSEGAAQSAVVHWLGSQGQRHRSLLLLSSVLP